MKAGEWIARLDRLQQGRRFKIAATIAVFALVLGGYIALAVAANAPGAGARLAARAAERAQERSRGLLIDRGPLDAARVIVDSVLLSIRPIEGVALPVAEGESAPPPPPRSSAGAVLVAGVMAGIGAGMTVLIWLGIGLSSLGVLALAWAVAWPLMSWPPMAGLGRVLMAAAPLVLAFTTGMALLRAALSGPWPLAAVARNVLAEAVRMKVSLVFIVILVFLLSYAPQALNEAQPLRYRVQNWLQYGTGLSYVVLAMLTLFLSVGTVAFEQRDKVIWQTMTKPVPPWQYLLGKWLGVMGLNAVLLGVTASGVYLFTEYLRHQPAQGEMAYHVRSDGAVTLGNIEAMTEDRRLLETQVLVARVGREMEPFFGEAMLARAVEDALARRASEDQTLARTDAERARIRDDLIRQREQRLREIVEARVRDMKASDPILEVTQDLKERTFEEVLTTQEALHRTVPPGTAKVYLFTGLAGARAPSAPPTVTLRYRVNAGSNDPAQLYRVRIAVGDQMYDRQIALGSSQMLLFDRESIAEDGSVVVAVENSGEDQREISFPPGGMEVLYVAGGYETNFLRIVLVMWMKLSFTAAVAIAAASFLAFPVACLVSMTVLLAAESAGYLTESLKYYVSKTQEGIDYFAVLVRLIAVPIAGLFHAYSELRPSAKLVDGRLVGWETLGSSLLAIGAATATVLGVGWAIFRRRELATYSGR
jgi:ABC-type transport system involved in multi-copper enzyme maturation permease subunit